MTHEQALSFVKSLRTQRRSAIADLREENAELIKIIADYDTRLALAEKRCTELEIQLSNCQNLLKATEAKSCAMKMVTVSDNMAIPYKNWSPI